MSFWASKIGAPAAPPAPPAPTHPWWQPVAPAPQPAYQAPPAPVAQPVQAPQQASVAPNGESHFGDLLQQDGYTTTRAQSAKDGTVCPDCSSPNFVSPSGQPNVMKQCFECGYNPRFSHSTAGASGIGQKNVAPPKAARVQNVAVAGAPPMGSIVGRA